MRCRGIPTTGGRRRWRQTRGSGSGHDLRRLCSCRMSAPRTPKPDAIRQALERLLDETRVLGCDGPASGRTSNRSQMARPRRGTARRSHAQPRRTLILPSGVSVVCHPVTLQPTAGISLVAPLTEVVAAFEPLSFEALTSFLSRFESQPAKGPPNSPAALCSTCPSPAFLWIGRGEFCSVCSATAKQLLRYLLMLLADDDGATTAGDRAPRKRRKTMRGRRQRRFWIAAVGTSAAGIRPANPLGLTRSLGSSRTCGRLPRAAN